MHKLKLEGQICAVWDQISSSPWRNWKKIDMLQNTTIQTVATSANKNYHQDEYK